MDPLNANESHRQAARGKFAQQPPTTLSRLEQLPDALLERICIHSGNVNLARSSPHLLQTLNTDNVKEGLMKRVFSSWQIKEHEEGEDIDWDDAIDHDWLPHAQESLLRTRWCSPERLTRTLQHHLMVTAFHVLKNWMWRAPEDQRDALTQHMWYYFQQMFTVRERTLERGNNIVPTREEEGWATWRYGMPGEIEQDPIRFQVTFDGLGRPADMEIIARIFPSRRTRREPKRWRVYRLSAPNFVRPQEIPTRLLRGPWTQIKGNLLRMLQTSWEPGPRADPAALQAGLEDALRESCVPAILALTRMDGRNLGEIGRCLESLPPRRRRDRPFVGNVHASDPWAGFDDLWAGAEQLWHLRPASLWAYPIRLEHFEVLFERAPDFGPVAFGNLAVILMKEAVAARTCSLGELVDRARMAEFRGPAHTPWAAGFWGATPQQFVMDAWNYMENSL